MHFCLFCHWLKFFCIFEERGERVVERETLRIARANGHPSYRISKTVILAWQTKLMNFIKENAERHIMLHDIEEPLVEEFENFEINDIVEALDNSFDDLALESDDDFIE